MYPVPSLSPKAQVDADRTVGLTDIGFQNIKTALADCIVSGNTANPFGGSIEISYHHIFVDSEYTIGNTIQDYIGMI